MTHAYCTQTEMDDYTGKVIDFKAAVVYPFLKAVALHDNNTLYLLL